MAAACLLGVACVTPPHWARGSHLCSNMPPAPAIVGFEFSPLHQDRSSSPLLHPHIAALIPSSSRTPKKKTKPSFLPHNLTPMAASNDRKKGAEPADWEWAKPAMERLYMKQGKKL